MDNPKNAPKPYQSQHTFSRGEAYKISIYKITFLYISNEQAEKEIKKVIPFIIASKRIKYPRVNFIEEVSNLYTKKYKNITERNQRPK